MYRVQGRDGRNFFARFRRINRLATPPDWTTRAARLRHLRTRRIARFVNAIDHDEYAVLLSEHTDGERLHDLLRRSGPLQPTRALTIAQQVGIAVEALHDASLSHGRLNPRGILVSTDARGALRVTVISYGLASSLEPPAPAPGYLPDGANDYEPANDIFAIGALLFEMLTGCSPVDGAVDEAIRDIAPAPLKNPSALNPRLRTAPHLDQVVQRLTSADGPPLSISRALELLVDAYDNPSSIEMLPISSNAFISVDTGLGSALSSASVGRPAETVTIERGGLSLQLHAAQSVVKMSDPNSDGAPLQLVDIAAHGVDGHVSRLLVLGRRLLIGTTRGALLCYDIDDGSFETLCPSSDSTAVVAIDACDHLVIAATRRGSIVSITETAGHVMAPDGLVTSICVAANGRRFAVGRASGAVEVFEIVQGRPAAIDDFSAAEVTGVKLSADGKELWLSDRDTTTVRDLATRSNFGVMGAANELIESSEALVHSDED